MKADGYVTALWSSAQVPGLQVGDQLGTKNIQPTLLILAMFVTVYNTILRHFTVYHTPIGLHFGTIT